MIDVRWGYLPVSTFCGAGTFAACIWEPNQDLFIPHNIRFFHANFCKNFDHKVALLKHVRSIVEKKPQYIESIDALLHKHKAICIVPPGSCVYIVVKLLNMLSLGDRAFRYLRKVPASIGGVTTVLNNMRENEILITHLWYNTSLASYLERLNVHCLLMYQDPRNQLVSHAHEILKRHKTWLSPCRNIAIDDIINYLFHKRAHNSCLPLPTTREFHAQTWRFVSLPEEYRNFYLPWCNHKNVLGISLESLIAQSDNTHCVENITSIASHLGFSLEANRIMKIAEQFTKNVRLLCEESSWEKCMNNDQKKLLKASEELSQLLVMLGYEK